MNLYTSFSQYSEMARHASREAKFLALNIIWSECHSADLKLRAISAQLRELFSNFLFFPKLLQKTYKKAVFHPKTSFFLLWKNISKIPLTIAQILVPGICPVIDFIISAKEVDKTPPPVKHVEFWSCSKFAAGFACRVHTSTSNPSRHHENLVPFQCIYGFAMLQWG